VSRYDVANLCHPCSHLAAVTRITQYGANAADPRETHAVTEDLEAGGQAA
jgi:hypothetical protein